MKTLIAIIVMSVAVGCAEDKPHREARHAVEDYRAGDFRAAQEKLEKISQETNEDFVLNNCRLGSTALGSYDLDEAEAAFLRAYASVAGASPLLPADPLQRASLLDLFLIEKALYELRYELNTRPEWVRA